MSKVFVSHSTLDSAFASRLCGDLRVAGHEPWLDRDSVLAGQGVIRQIEEAIQECNHFVVVLSQAAVKSEWVEAEVHAALWNRLSNRRGRIIPALSEACDIPQFLSGIRYADFTGSYAVGFAQVFSSLASPSGARRWPPALIPDNFLNAIEFDARTHDKDHIRIACIHTVWSYRPERALPIIEDARRDWSEVVKNHALVLLGTYT